MKLTVTLDTYKELNMLNQTDSAQLILIGQMDNTMDHTLESANRVYDPNGISPTIPTCCGGGHQPKILEVNIVRSIGRDPSNPSDRTAGNPNLEQRLEINSQGICNNLTTVAKDNYVMETSLAENTNDWTFDINGKLYEIRIRKLTPRECYRLMGFSDEDFEKAQAVNSNTRLYAQAGNSIVEDVLKAIFKQML
jgi:DNA (cytosine-5)-methyltransferase 1